MWRQAHLEAVMSGLLQLSYINSSKTGKEEEVSHFSPGSDPAEVWKFSLDDIRGPVCTTQKVTIPLFGTASVHANLSVKGYCMWVYVLKEPMPGPHLPSAVVLTVTYGELHPRSSRVPICLCNLSAHTMEILAKAVVGQVALANQIPPVVHPTRTSKEWHNQPKKDESWRLWISRVSKNGLNQSINRPGELLLKWEHLFAHSDLDLGKTVLD